MLLQQMMAKQQGDKEKGEGSAGLCAGQQLFVAAVHAQSAQRSGDKDGQNRHRQHDLAAGKPQSQGHRADGRLDSCFGQVGNHAEQTLFAGQGSFQHAEPDARRAENQCQQDHGHRR